MSSPYPQFVARLSELSVRKYYRAYEDVPWDEPGYEVSADDPRFSLPPDHALAATAWYRDLSARDQARFGLAQTCQTLKYGIGFEAVLSIGLAEFARTLPNGSPEYRYALHELIEESQHSLMFQEFINRAGTDPRPVGRVEAWFDRRVAPLGRSFPELFFGCVLAGEIFIDHDNRKAVRHGAGHPLLRKIIQIHITEEARHVCFAQRFLRERLPRLSWPRRQAIALAMPFVLSDSARMMLRPSPRLVREFGIPRTTLREAFGPRSAYRLEVERTVEPIRALLHEHGMFGPLHAWHWRRRGLLTKAVPGKTGVRRDDRHPQQISGGRAGPQGI